MQCNLLISDLRLWVHLGCSAEEKFHSQLVSVNIDFTFKSSPLGLTTDRLGGSSEYSISRSKQAIQFNRALNP